MKKKYVVVLLLLTLLHLTASSQSAQVKMVENVDSIQLDESKDLQAQLLPLDSIILIAIKNSPGVKFQKDLIEASKYQIEFMKRIWTNNITPYFNYNTGNQNLVAADAQNPGGLSSTNLTSGYRAGIQVNLPLYEILGRKARINLYKADLQSSINKEEQIEQETIQVLIEEYYTLIYYRNLITIRSEAKQTDINQSLVAQQEFKDGIIQASELSRLQQIEVNARADYEEVKRQFAIHYFQFQNLVGVPIRQMMRTK